MENIYREYLLEHYKNPKNKGIIEQADIKIYESNPLCGDEITLYIKLEDDIIKDLRFDGKGCVISMASASILSDELIGKRLIDIKDFDSEYMLGLLNLKLTPTRVKCAMLALGTLKKALENRNT